MHNKKMVAIACLVLFPMGAFAAGRSGGSLETQIWILAIFNTLLVITSAISILQFITHKEHNRTPFQAFNIIFAVVFYAISIFFLLHHKDYFEGLGNLNDIDFLKRYFLDTDWVSWVRCIIPIAVILNIIYLIRFAPSYYLE